ncbi:uncharacterized protein [Struthio camelus]|uniref:uncharacterized protein isoform X1 n=1 Tax=Struthio camelus TaxID=8801 RepID=UPI00360423D8
MLERKWGVVRNIREEEGTGKVGEELELLLGRRASMQPRQSCNIGALLFGPMVLSLGLLLHAQQAVSQELCEAPGHLPAPSIFLSPTAARMGETVQLQCTVDTSGHISRIIFCHNGQEASAMKGEKKSIYNHYESVSAASSGNYSCGYEIRDIMNRVTRSQFSPVQHLHIQGDKPEGTHTAAGPSEEPTLAGQRFVLSLGISVPCILLLAALGCLIIRKGARASRRTLQKTKFNMPPSLLHELPSQLAHQKIRHRRTQPLHHGGTSIIKAWQGGIRSTRELGSSVEGPGLSVVLCQAHAPSNIPVRLP